MPSVLAEVSPAFQKFVLQVCLLCFYKRIILVPVFTNWKTFKEDFHFYKNRYKKNSIRRLFCRSRYRGSAHPERRWEWHRQAPSQDLHSASVAKALNCVCKHLCFISIYFVHALARCVLRYLLLCLHHFGLWKVSQEHSTVV